ncbi:MAG: biliverdin-producing heme oxygenase [Caulobacter sp.]
MNAHVTIFEPSRAKRLKALTHTTHEQLDSRIMSLEPFRDQERFGRFLRAQHGFHREIDALYTRPELVAVLPDLPDRRRLALIAQDIADLGQVIPAAGAPPVFQGDAVDLPTAFGWLYVAEGSNLGAAFLLKAAAALGLGETFGARHLAAHPQGRGRHWRAFVAALDGLSFDEIEDSRAVQGAAAAFRRVRGLVDDAFA